MYRLVQKQSLSIIDYDPLKVCGSVFIHRDSALCTHVLIISVLQTFLGTARR